MDQRSGDGTGIVGNALMRHLGALSWPAATASADHLLAVPLGSVEQHGPHLPLDTDTRVACALTAGLAARRTDVLAAPPLAYGSSGEHGAFVGTLSIGPVALEAVLVELVRSAGAFAGVVLVNGHGGNCDALARACGRLVAEGRAVLGWSPRADGGDAHAGRVETSLLLAIAPGSVKMDRAERGCTRELSAIAPTLRSRGVAAVSPNGVLGDPSGANAEEGRALIAMMIDSLVSAVDERWR